jgi:hypothetical protein
MTRIGKRTGLAIAALALAIALVAPATAPAATTVVGKVNLSATTANGSNLCGNQSCTSLNTAVDSAQTYVVSSPVDGAVTSWSFRTPSMNAAAGTVYALRVVHPAGNNTFQSIAATNSVTIPDTAGMVRGPFTVSPGISIKKGDLIGLKVTSSLGTVPTVSGSNTNAYKVFAPNSGTMPHTDLTDGGPAIAPQQDNTGNQIPIQATITFTTPPPGCPPNCPPPAPVPPGPKPSLTRLSLSPKTFRAASRGGSVARTRRRVIPIGTKVSYRLSQAATTTFTLERAATGRRVNRRCVAPRRSNRTRPRCTRYLRVSGSFTRVGSAGANSFKFTGRLRGRKLSPGSYRLTGVASNANGKSSAVTATFKIVR